MWLHARTYGRSFSFFDNGAIKERGGYQNNGTFEAEYQLLWVD